MTDKRESDDLKRIADEVLELHAREAFDHSDNVIEIANRAPALARAYLEGIEEKKRLTAERNASDAALLRVPSILAPCLAIEEAQEAARLRQRGEKK